MVLEFIKLLEVLYFSILFKISGLQLRNTLREAEDREGWRKLVAKSSRGAPTVIQTTGHR